MFLLAPSADEPPALIFSASDLVTASECPYRSLRLLDEKLGRTARANFSPDPMLQRAAELGDAFEHKILGEYLARYGPWDPATGRGVKLLERGPLNWAALVDKREETLAALRGGADVVFQATFFDGALVGFADFLVRDATGAYEVWDTKLARHTRVSALLQLAAYGDQLRQHGIPLSPRATLLLGDRTQSHHPMPDLLPVFRERRDDFVARTHAHRAQEAPVHWLQEDVPYCGRCDYCSEQVRLHRDLLLVNGMTGSRRRQLLADGVTSIDALAALPTEAAQSPLARLQDQARMQLGLSVVDGTATAGTGAGAHPVSYKVLRESVSALPEPSPGDLFFDFEGDPLWQDAVSERWGLEYLFGTVEAPVADREPRFVPLWAHSRMEERLAFLAFLDYVQARRVQFPGLHVYHYAPYEKAALRNLSVLHGVGEDIVDDWLRSGLLVDLLDTVRASVRISADSYSIKKLEPFYMAEGRDGSVTNAGASVVAYAAYCAARDAGAAGDADQAAEAAQILRSIGAYNHYDCLSTLRLRDWLLRIGAAVPLDAWTQDSGKQAALLPAPAEPPAEEAALQEYVDGLLRTPGHVLSDDERAVELVAAAASYHRREDKHFWWGHFDRLEQAPQAWAAERNVFLIERAEVVQDWALATPRARTESRTVRLTGRASEGSDFRPGTSWCGLFDAPLPEGLDAAGSGGRGALFNVTVLADESTTPELTTLLVREKSTTKVPAYTALPRALTPDQPVNTKSIRAALSRLAATVSGTVPALPRHPGIELLRRAAPRLLGGAALPAVDPGADGGPGNYIAAISAAVMALDASYLAVQGPPGTGKTHVGAHVIAALVARGWKVGVVGSSHAVVENMLRSAIDKGGVDPRLVGKKLAAPHEVPWEVTDDKAFARLLAAPEGALLGGTAWTMTGASIPEGAFDLLVIDEAGQFSLANTLAVAQSTRRLLLLGDPAQLPQVTQGSHPAPVDESALGWLAAGRSVLPPTLGYFLADSWRMHPELCSVVSRLSYDAKLRSAPAAGQRELLGKAPGVETVWVRRDPDSARENRQSSPEEARAVVRQVREHVGLPWTSAAGAVARPLGAADLLVVAAYNAQVHLVRGALDAAGLQDVRVGTVDKFQGQEAAVVLITMACADPSGAPRGMEFLLNRNRINVALSRGQWRAVLIRSPELTRFMPTTAAGMAELGAFIGIGAAAVALPAAAAASMA